MGAKKSLLKQGRQLNDVKKRNQSLKEAEDKIIETVSHRIATEFKDNSTVTSNGLYILGNSRHERAMSLWDDIDRKSLSVNPEDYMYPFENLVFEGGGNKAFAYCGAIQCLEELNLMSQIKRLGGSSAGAITAALVALGYTSEDIREFMTENIETILLDHMCGCLSLLPNVLRRWGWNPGYRIYEWLGEKIKAKTQSNNPDLTFYELYQEKGIELCIVVTNLNQMRSEYCHPKTTPDMHIREALRMTISIPGVFMARLYDNYGQKDTYVDGGVLCNYPIHCFDGWYLSMEKDDAFLLRMLNLRELPRKWAVKSTFNSINLKTLGFLLYDDTENEIMRYSLEQRIGSLTPDAPIRCTKLYREKLRKTEIKNEFEREHSKCLQAAESFMKALYKHNLNAQVVISKQQLKEALEDESSFPQEDKELLFGSNISLDDAFAILDKDCNGQIAIQELLNFLEVKGIRMQSRIHGYDRMEISSFVDFVLALQKAWLINMKEVYAVDADINRTVGINTGHIGTSNYILEDEDRDFLVKRGYNATMAFMRYFVINNPAMVRKRKSGDTSGLRTLTTIIEDTKL